LVSKPSAEIRILRQFQTRCPLPFITVHVSPDHHFGAAGSMGAIAHEIVAAAMNG
jgi:hypothetical protein